VSARRAAGGQVVGERAGGADPAPPGAVPLHQDIYMLTALSGTAALLLAWTLPLWIGAWQVLCPLRELTGIPCPTCFGTRALLALTAGDWRTALRLNPMVAAGAIGLLAGVPWAGATAVVGLPRARLSAGATAGLARAAVLAVLGNWLYLLLAHV
jgi:hypothetical protein